MALNRHLDVDMTLTWNFKFSIKHGFCLHGNPHQVI